MILSAATTLQTTPPVTSGLATIADVATIVAAVAAVALTVAVLGVLRDVSRTLHAIRSGVHAHLGPVSDRLRTIADHVESITRTLRADAVRFDDSVKALTGRLRQASDRMEERVEEFNALMEVVQAEAEDIFLDTAATVRGVREGARRIVPAGSRSTRGNGRTGDGAAPAPPREPSLDRGTETPPDPAAGGPDVP